MQTQLTLMTVFLVDSYRAVNGMFIRHYRQWTAWFSQSTRKVYSYSTAKKNWWPDGLFSQVIISIGFTLFSFWLIHTIPSNIYGIFSIRSSFAFKQRCCVKHLRVPGRNVYLLFLGFIKQKKCYVPNDDILGEN